MKQPSAPPVDLAGRWTLTAPGSRSCVMTMTTQPGAGEGAVAASRGCPYNFNTTRKWTYEDDTLVLRPQGRPAASAPMPTGSKARRHPAR